MNPSPPVTSTLSDRLIEPYLSTIRPLLIYEENVHNDSTYSRLPSVTHPSSWAASLSCCPRCLLTPRKLQERSASEVRSPQSFSNWATGKMSSWPCPHRRLTSLI